MVLAGLVIAIGEVLDDAIIDVENIYRRLRLNRLAETPQSLFHVVLEASLEVRSAIVYASLIVILVFVPVFFLGGLAGTFFRPLAFTYIAAISASLIVALTVMPAMSLILLRGQGRREKESPLVVGLKRLYRLLLSPVLKRPMIALTVVVLCYAGTVVLWGQLSEEFLPDFQERDFLMHWVEKPATSIDAMRRITVEVSKELRAIPGVHNFGAHIGRAEAADEVVGANFTELWISIDPEVDYQTTLTRITDVVEGYPGLYRDVLTYLRERVKEVLTGTSATIVVRIFGPDLETLRELAASTAESMRDIEGVKTLKMEQITLVPQVQVRLRMEAISDASLTPGQVRRTLATYTKGLEVGEIYEDQKIHKVVVWGRDTCRTDIQALRELPIETPFGTYVTLVSHYRHLEDEEGMSFGNDLVLRGSLERSSPILMTVCTTALALIPLVMRGNIPGHEIEYPLAIVILGGLVSSTLLNLFVMPTLYLAIGRSAARPVPE